MIFAPGTLESAPQTHIAAIEAPVAAEDAVEKAATDGFPNISAIRVRDALAAAANLVAGIGAAVTGMASITILVGALVLSAVVGANRRVNSTMLSSSRFWERRVDAFWVCF